MTEQIEQYLRQEDPLEWNWDLTENRLEVLIDFVIYLRESEEWRQIEGAWMLNGGKIVTENDEDFNEDNWEPRP